MNAEILQKLSKITEEERAILSQEEPALKRFYAKPGRFLIERRRISNIVYGFDTAPITLRPHPRFCRFPAHSHDFIEMMFVCSGNITHKIKDEALCLSAGDLIILAKGTAHEIEKTGENDLGINLLLSTDLFEKQINKIRSAAHCQSDTFDGLLRGNPVPFSIFSLQNDLVSLNLIEILIHLFLTEKIPDEFMLEKTLTPLLCRLAILSQQQSFTVAITDSETEKRNKLLTYLRTSYSTATLTEAADMMGLAPTYLSRWIKQTFGTSFKEMLMNERFDTARELLENTEMPIGEIITRVGYENSSYFHKEFKKRFGITPKHYRKQAP